MLASTASTDLVFDEGQLIDGFVHVNDAEIHLDTWYESNNGYFGITDDDDKFYLIVTDELVKIKIWADDKIRLIEPIN